MCWHKWGKWKTEYSGLAHKPGTELKVVTGLVVLQTRACEKCNFIQTNKEWEVL